MNIQIAPAPVRKSLVVKASPARAFELFIGRMTSWWHPEHHIGKSPLKEAVVEPRAGGRWYEIGEDGTQCEWGKVLVWEPPARVVFAWQINGQWQYDPDFLTEVEVRFIPDGTGTRVELEHRNIDRFGTNAQEIRAVFDSPEGWGRDLKTFADLADESAA